MGHVRDHLSHYLQPHMNNPEWRKEYPRDKSILREVLLPLLDISNYFFYDSFHTYAKSSLEEHSILCENTCCEYPIHARWSIQYAIYKEGLWGVTISNSLDIFTITLGFRMILFPFFSFWIVWFLLLVSKGFLGRASSLSAHHGTVWPSMEISNIFSWSSYTLSLPRRH